MRILPVIPLYVQMRYTINWDIYQNLHTMKYHGHPCLSRAVWVLGAHLDTLRPLVEGPMLVCTPTTE